MKLAEAINEFMFYITSIDQKANATIHSYVSDIHKYVTYLKDKEGIIDVEEILANHIEDYILNLSSTHKNSSVNRSIISIRAFHRILIQNNLTSHNPTSLLVLSKKGLSLPKYITQEQMQNFLSYKESDAYLNSLHQAILELLYGGGLRVSEVVSLHLNQLHLEQGVVKVLGKGQKERLVPLNQICIQSVGAYVTSFRTLYNKQKLSILFVNKHGRVLTRQYIDQMIKRRCDTLGIQRMSAHMLRHAYATHLLEGGADLRSVQELLGHAYISTTQVYTHVQVKQLKSAYTLSEPKKHR